MWQAHIAKRAAKIGRWGEELIPLSFMSCLYCSLYDSLTVKAGITASHMS